MLTVLRKEVFKRKAHSKGTNTITMVVIVRNSTGADSLCSCYTAIAGGALRWVRLKEAQTTLGSFLIFPPEKLLPLAASAAVSAAVGPVGIGGGRRGPRAGVAALRRVPGRLRP